MGIASITLRTMSERAAPEISTSAKPSRIHLPSAQDSIVDRKKSIMNEAFLPSLTCVPKGDERNEVKLPQTDFTRQGKE